MRRTTDTHAERVTQWLSGCEVAWIECASPAEALALETATLEMRDDKFAVIDADGRVLTVERMQSNSAADVFALTRERSSCSRPEWN